MKAPAGVFTIPAIVQLSVQGCPEGEQLVLDCSVPLKVSSTCPLLADCVAAQFWSVPLMVRVPAEGVPGEPPPGSSTSVSRPKMSEQLLRELPASSVAVVQLRA